MYSRPCKILISARQATRYRIGFVLVALTCNSRDQIEYMKLAARMTK